MTRVQTGRVVIPPRDYGLVRRAKGRFVLAAMRIKNTGNEPLRGLYDVKLKIGDKIYDQSSDRHLDRRRRSTRSRVQPGDSAVAALVFDLPVTAAREALSDGVLAFPAGDDLAARRGRGRSSARSGSPSRARCAPGRRRREGLGREARAGGGTPPARPARMPENAEAAGTDARRSH